MTWQTILAIIIMASSSALGAMLTQYPADRVPHWIPVVLAVLGTVGGALRGVGVIGGPKPPEVPR